MCLWHWFNHFICIHGICSLNGISSFLERSNLNIQNRCMEKSIGWNFDSHSLFIYFHEKKFRNLSRYELTKLIMSLLDHSQGYSYFLKICVSTDKLFSTVFSNSISIAYSGNILLNVDRNVYLYRVYIIDYILKSIENIMQLNGYAN